MVTWRVDVFLCVFAPLGSARGAGTRAVKTSADAVAGKAGGVSRSTRVVRRRGGVRGGRAVSGAYVVTWRVHVFLRVFPPSGRRLRVSDVFVASGVTCMWRTRGGPSSTIVRAPPGQDGEGAGLGRMSMPFVDGDDVLSL